jgi:hypothetical protein
MQYDFVLGSGFRPPVRIEPPEPPVATVEDLRTEQLLLALQQLHEALSAMPAPVVQVAEPDLTAIVNAVTQLNGPATPDEIAQAVVSQIGGDTRSPIEPVLADLVEALKTLDFRLKGLGSSGGGGGGPSTVSLSESTIAALSSSSSGTVRALTERMLAKAPTAGYALWLDTVDPTYIYVAEAPVADVGTSATFRGVRVTKDATGNPLGKVQQAENFAWDTRSAAVWS